jgi:hypothetical protein
LACTLLILEISRGKSLDQSMKILVMMMGMKIVIIH